MCTFLETPSSNKVGIMCVMYTSMCACPLYAYQPEASVGVLKAREMNRMFDYSVLAV